MPMSEIYTEDLIKFIYNETTADETVAIRYAIQDNNTVKAAYESLKEILAQMDAMTLSPSQTSINIIMEEAHRQSEALAH
jgi:hypothetical protein